MIFYRSFIFLSVVGKCVVYSMYEMYFSTVFAIPKHPIWVLVNDQWIHRSYILNNFYCFLDKNLTEFLLISEPEIPRFLKHSWFGHALVDFPSSASEYSSTSISSCALQNKKYIPLIDMGFLHIGRWSYLICYLVHSKLLKFRWSNVYYVFWKDSWSYSFS